MLAACVAFVVIPALSLSAQPTPQTIGFDDLPGPLNAFNPQSGLYKASQGTLTDDADKYLSVLDFNRLSTNKWFFEVGVDESFTEGLNVGFGAFIGKAYLGVGYGGSLIDELAMLLTNKTVYGMKLERTNTDTPILTNNAGEELTAEKSTSDNSLSVIFGTGIFGLKLGFHEFVQGINSKDGVLSIESSLKPSLELGFNAGKGKFRFMWALRAAYDLHQYQSNATTTVREIAGATATTWTTVRKDSFDFNEGSAGITLGFDFQNSAHTQAELDIIADLRYRGSLLGDWLGYVNDDMIDLVISVWDIRDTTTSSWATATPVKTVFKTSEIEDLRIPGAISFTYKRDITPKVTIGGKLNVYGEFNFLNMTQFETAGTDLKYETEITNILVKPDLAVGVNFNLLPDHFAVYGGLGIELFSYDQTTTKTDIFDVATGDKVDDDSDTVKTIGVPTVRLAFGLKVNFTKNAALDLLAVAANVTQIDATKLTMLFTIKK
jgi:hypothetical protein